MNCAGQKFGHNFIGDICLNCGVSQRELSYGKPQKIEIVMPAKKPFKNIHTDKHSLAKEICDFYKENKFGTWLGIISRKGHQTAFEAFAEAKQYKKSAKWLMWRLSKKYDQHRQTTFRKSP